MSLIKKNSKDSDLIMIPEKKTFGQKITDLFIEYRYLLLAFIIPVFLMYLLYVSIGIFPFGDKTVLGLDLNAQYVDFYYGLRNVIHGDADALYTFARSLGGEFMGIYSYYVASPFAAIVALFPRNMMAHALLVLFLFKTGLSGFTFGFYLHKTYKFKNKTAIVGFSILYALSAYAVVQQHNNMWIDALVWLPIITYGIEQLIKFGKYKIFVIFLALTIISNFYIGYMMCFYVVIYFLFYYIAHPKQSVNPTDEKNHFIKSAVRFGFFSLLAVAIAALIILTTWYSLKLGKTTFSETKWFDGVKFNLLELIPKFFTGSYDSVNNSGMPLIYCGIGTVLLVPLYFCAKQFKIREKLAYAGLMLVFILSFWISDLDLIWHGMQKPNWLPYRYSFLLIFVLLVVAYRAFSNIRNISSNAIVTTTFCIAIVVTVCGTVGLKHFNPWAGFLLTALLVIGYSAFLIFISKDTVKRSILTFSMVGLICIESVINGVYTMYAANADALSFTSYNKFTSYFENYFEVSDALKEYDPAFYRMENLGTRDSIKKNDGMATGMRGIAGSTSTLNEKTIRFLHNIGYRAGGHLSYYSGHCNVNDSLLGIKYVLSKGNNNTTAAMNSIVNGYLKEYKEIKIEGYDGEYQIFENPYALPFAYGVNSSYADLSLNESQNYPLENLNSLVGAMLGDPDYTIFEEIALDGDLETGSAIKISHGDSYAKYYIDPSNNSSKEEADKSVIFSFSVPEGANDEDLYFYMPWAIYKRAVKVDVSTDGKKYESVINGYGKDGYHALLVGNYKAGTTLKLRFVIDNSNSNLWLGVDSKDNLTSSGLYYLDSDKYTSAMKTLAEGVIMDIDDSSTDAHIHGSINNVKTDKQLIFTSIPYDAGWVVTVDGKAVDTYESNDSLLYFYVDKGNHTVSLDYSPSCVKYGLIISISGVALFAILCTTEFVLKKKGIKCAVFACPSHDEVVDSYPDEHIYDDTKKVSKSNTPNGHGQKKKRK